MLLDYHLVSDILAMVAVALVWGITNAVMSRNSANLLTVERSTFLQQHAAEFHYLFTNWKYVSALVINATGSVGFYALLTRLDLSIVSPVANCMTFVFTAFAESFLYGAKYSNRAYLGILLTSIGVLLCALSKL